MNYLGSHRVIHNPHLSYRPDIDGLRTLAVLSVLIFHAFPNVLRGGFVGVDIFFVISGYLITSIILKAQSNAGFNLLEFYSHRIKRIFPSLIVVLVFSLIIAWYVLLADEYKALGKHVAAGAGYVSNLLLKQESGYFDIAAELKPLLHLWSLGIEEQFYLIWPLLLILALRANLNPLAVITFCMVVSFMLNVFNVEHKTTQVFYLPLTRSWELLTGAVLSYFNLYTRDRFDQVVGHALLRNPHDEKSLANVLAWFGLILIGLALVGLDKGKPFPGWWALFPVMGAVCLMAAGEKAWLNQRVFASRGMVYIGLISYPLYLWHWPLLAFARISEGDTPKIGIRMLALILSFFLAWLTYTLVEKRLRFSQHNWVSVGLLLTLVFTGGVGYGVYHENGLPNRYPNIEKVAANVSSISWANQGLNVQTTCTKKFGDQFQQYCMIYDHEKVPDVMLLGDSNANHFYPGLAQAYALRNENLLNLGQGACPPLFGVESSIVEGDLHCGKSMGVAMNYALKTASVKTVILSMLGLGYWREERTLQGGEGSFINLRYAGGGGETDNKIILETALRTTLQRFSSADKNVIFILGIPMLDFDPATCVDVRPLRLTEFHPKQPCAIPREKFDRLNSDYQAMILRVTGDFPNVKTWDASRELCDQQYCWAIRDNQLLYRDAVHLNQAGSKWLGEKFLRQ